MNISIERKSGYEVNGEKHRDANACMEEDQPARLSAVTHATIKPALKYGHDDKMVLESGEFQRPMDAQKSFQVARTTKCHSECDAPSHEACEIADR